MTIAVILFVGVIVVWLTWVGQGSVVNIIKKEAHKGRLFMANQAQETVDAVVAQLDKAKGEVLAEIQRLEEREPTVDFTALKAAAQGLDDVVADAPVEVPEGDGEPVEEAPLDEEPTEAQ